MQPYSCEVLQGTKVKVSIATCICTVESPNSVPDLLTSCVCVCVCVCVCLILIDVCSEVNIAGKQKCLQMC
jgi:hypothetical protein